MEKQCIFISSVQREFAEERKALAEYIRHDLLLNRYFEPFLFEELPAANISAQEAYLKQVASAIYLGIYGQDYGYEDAKGVSPTEREYDAAMQAGQTRLVFIKDCSNRHPKELAFIQKVEQHVVRKSFGVYEELRTAVYASLLRYLDEKEYLRSFPWDATLHPTATMADIDPQKVETFVELAREKRQFALTYSKGKIPNILYHLNLATLDGSRLTNAALLLFAKEPQRFFITSEIKCMVFPTTVKTKPILSYQVFHGSIFEMIDSAVGFVMQHIDAYVGQHTTTSADIHYELPIEAVTEVIVNACVHRSYESNGSVQVELYPDRLTVWNPGHLPFGLTPAKLVEEHSSLPPNPILANPVYLAGYVERIGTGTTDVVDACLKEGLPQPEFIQEDDFRTIIWRKTHIVEQKTHIAEPKTHIAESKTHIAEPTMHIVSMEGLNKRQKMVVEFCDTPKSSHEIIDHIGIAFQSRSVKRYVTDLVEAGYLLPLVLGKTTSPNQKYVRSIHVSQ